MTHRSLVLFGLFLFSLAGFSPEARPAPDLKKVLRVEFPVAETGFDPVLVHDLYSSTVVEAIFDPLLTYDYLASPAKLAPRAAEAMPVVENEGKVYTFRVRKGIHFYPDPAFKGQRRELTAEDFAYSIKRHKDPKNRSVWKFLLDGKIIGLDEAEAEAAKTGKFDYDQPIAGLKVLDRYTLRIELKVTDYNLGYILAMPSLGAVAREVVEAYPNDTNSHPVGTGPYYLKRWIRSAKIFLEANPEYRSFVWDFKGSDDAWDKRVVAEMKGKKMPQIGQVEINIIEEEQSAWLAFQNAELDLLYLRSQFSPVAIPEGKVNDQLAARGVRLNRITDPEITYHYFNMRDPVVGGYSKEKVALRRAILMAYDNNEEIRIIRKNQAMETHFPVPPGVVGHVPRYRAGNAYQVELANALLDRFGYRKGDDGWRTLPDGRPLVIRYASQPDSTARLFDELWKKSFDAIGVRMEVQKEKFAELLKLEKQCRLMMRGAAWIADYPDGDDFVMLLYGKNVGQSNNPCFELPEYDEIYERSTKMPPSPERDRLYVDLARLAENYGVWKLNNTRYRNMLVYPRVKGYKKHPILLADWMYLDLEP